MKRIKLIAVVLSMVLLLLGAAGNTEDKAGDTIVSDSGAVQKTAAEYPERISLAQAETIYIEDGFGFAESMENEEAEETLEETEAAEEEEQENLPQRVIEVSEEDYAALLKLVEAEASGEDMKGKMLVANVVLNRLNHGTFGSSIKEVIYQRVDGKAQFSPVSNGRIEKVVISAETIEAVERVLCGEDESQGALYFMARAYASAKNAAWFDRNLTWLFSHDGHEFYT